MLAEGKHVGRLMRRFRRVRHVDGNSILASEQTSEGGREAKDKSKPERSLPGQGGRPRTARTSDMNPVGGILER